MTGAIDESAAGSAAVGRGRPGRRRLPFGRTISLVFRTIVRHLGVCAAIAAVYAVPWGVANAVSRSSTRILDPLTLTSSQTVSAGIAAVLSLGAMVLIAVFLGSVTLGALSLVGSAAVYGDRIDSRGIVARATDRAFDAIAANLLFFLLIAAAPVALGLVAFAIALAASSSLAFSILTFGFFLLIAPLVLYLGARAGLAVPVVMRESRGPFDALRRSWQLTHGSWWRVFGVGLTLAIVPAVAQQLAEAFIGRGGAADFLLWTLASVLVAGLGAMLLGVGTGVIYASLVPEDVVPPDVAVSEARADEAPEASPAPSTHHGPFVLDAGADEAQGVVPKPASGDEPPALEVRADGSTEAPPPSGDEPPRPEVPAERPQAPPLT